MMKNNSTYNDFGKTLENYFQRYLVSELGVSHNTIRSYRDTFVLLIEFFEDVMKVHPDQLAFEHFTKDNITNFLDWLEAKGSAKSTRNNRCAAIKSMARYMTYTDPTHMAQWQALLSIKSKKATQDTVKYLSVDEITKILDETDLGTVHGRRDHTILSVLYYTGARAEELCGLTPSSIRLSKPYLVEVLGKGTKKRCIPIDDDVFALIQSYLREHGLDKPEQNKHPLFYNTWGGKLTTAGLAYIINKYVTPAKAKNPDLFCINVSPHTFRHSRSMHLLQAGVELVIIRDILGHVSIQTTEVYARVDSKLKRDAIAKAYNAVGKYEPKENSWDKDPKLKAFLKSLS